MIDIKTFNVIPQHLQKGFGFCLYGKLTEEIITFLKENKFNIEVEEKYTNFFPTKETDITKLFKPKVFKYMDGFSPNLNKNLHIGHFSNFVLAKSLQGLDVSEKYISILGDTLIGDVSKEESLEKFKNYCTKFNYKVDEIYFASEMKYDGDLLKDGTDEYAGTKIIEVDDNKLVVIKSDGSTSYFYQDMALASKLNADILYLTGYEQTNHFNTLNKIFPTVNHIGLGLVKFQSSKLDAKEAKMSTRLGNVVYMSDLMNDLMEQFNGNEQLCYNIFAGYILKNNPNSDKIFNMDNVKNPKNSPGLYLSYTVARLKSAGVKVNYTQDFIKSDILFNYLKSKSSLNPVYLFNSLVDLCKEINVLYTTNQIIGNEENNKMFQVLLSDLILGMNKLGLFEIDKV